MQRARYEYLDFGLGILRSLIMEKQTTKLLKRLYLSTKELYELVDVLLLYKLQQSHLVAPGWFGWCGHHIFQLRENGSQRADAAKSPSSSNVLWALMLGRLCDIMTIAKLLLGRNISSYIKLTQANLSGVCESTCWAVRLVVTWLILPAVICLSQRLSHACLSISFYTARLRTAH